MSAFIRCLPLPEEGVNVIPEEVVMETYIRANTLEALLEAVRKASMTVPFTVQRLWETCTVEDKTGYMPLKQSDEINQVIMRICVRSVRMRKL